MSQDTLYLFFSGLGVGIVLLIALYLLLPGLSAVLRARASQQWPSVEGIIVDSWIDRREYTQSVSLTRRFRVSFYPQVMYRYTVAGTTYEGQRIYFGGQVGGSESEAAKKLAAYPPGGAVEVFYAPSDPTNTVLERHPSWTPIYAGLGMLALTVGLATLLFIIR